MSATSGIFGLGKGDAQVWGANQALGYIAQAHQQDVARKQREDAEFQTQLAKINTDGARQADMQPIFSHYNDILKTYTQLRSTTDPIERNKIQNDIRSQQQQLMYGIGLSKDAKTQEMTLAKLRLDRNNDLRDDYGKQFQDLTNTSIFDNGYQTKQKYFNDPFIPKYDTDKFDKEILDSATGVKYGAVKEQDVNGFRILTRDEITALNPQKAKELIVSKIAADPSLRRTVLFNGTQNGETPEQAVNTFAEQMVQSLRARDKVVPKPIASQAPERPDKFYEHYNYALRHPKPGQGQAGYGDPIDINIPYNDGKSNVNAKGYVPVSIPSKNFAGVTAYNLSEGGKDAQALPSGNYEMVGVGNFPVINTHVKDTNGKDLYGTLAQPSYAKNHPENVTLKPFVHTQSKDAIDNDRIVDNLIDYNKMPENIKNSKAVQAALKNFTPASGVQRQSPVKPPTQQKPSTGGYGNITTAKDASGQVIQMGVKNGKWYNIKTNKPL